jgi:Uma2 family endonuclease
MAEVRQPVRFSPEEFYTLVEQRVVPEFSELVDGQIIEMPGQNYLAVAVIGEVFRILSAAWRDRWAVGSHLTHPFTSGWNPMPDVSVYDRRPPAHPRRGSYPKLRLAVEVSDSTLAYDLGDKASRYAAEGVEELWVADAENRQLHVFRSPIDGAWQEHQELGGADAVSPLCLPTLALRVGELFPPTDEA